MIRMYPNEVATRRCRDWKQHGLLPAVIAGAALGAIVLSAPKVNAAEPTRALYDLSSGPQGACPGMDWHVVVSPDKTVSGVVGWDKMQHLAKLSGTVGQDGKLNVTATEEGSSKTENVSGTDDGSHLKVGINGTGTSCDNTSLDVPRVTSTAMGANKG